MKPILFLDTCALLNLRQNAFKERFAISQQTLQEIERIKTSSSKDGEVKFKARSISRLLDDNYGEYDVVPTSENVKAMCTAYQVDETPDNIIVGAAKWYNNTNKEVLFCTDDLNCKFSARDIFGLNTKSTNELNLVTDIKEYKGYVDIKLSDDQLADFYQNPTYNMFNCLTNQYVIIRNENDDVIDSRKWNGEEYIGISFKPIKNDLMGKVKPINPEQSLAFDLLQNKEQTIKIITGKAGSGKDYVMLANALELLKSGYCEKLIYVRNPVEVKDVKEIGYLPGTKEEKLEPFIKIISDHIGEIPMDMYMKEGKISIEHLGHIRGRDFSNAIIYCTEAENLTKEHVQLLISRLGQNSSIWINGDFKQTDNPLFRVNSGLITAVNALAGQKRFGYVRFNKVERSETAALADLLD